MLDAVLSTGENSRLYNALVRTGKAVETTEYFESNQEGGFMSPFAILKAGTALPDVANIIAAEMERVRKDGVSAAELTEAKNQLLAAALVSRETASGRALRAGRGAGLGRRRPCGRPQAAGDHQGNGGGCAARRAQISGSAGRRPVHLHAGLGRSRHLGQSRADAGLRPDPGRHRRALKLNEEAKRQAPPPRSPVL